MAKYKIGQKVRFIGGSEGKPILHITEIQEITCSAGTQVFYIGRLWMPNRYSAHGEACAKELWKASEIELAAVKEEKAKKTKKE